MGLSSFWSNIKGKRASKVVVETHHDNIYAQHLQIPPSNAHVALSNDDSAWTKTARVDHPAAKKLKRRSFWRANEADDLPTEDPTPLLPPTQQKQVNRRSAWRSESQLRATSEQYAPQQAAEEKKAKRTSLWRSQSEAKSRPRPIPMASTFSAQSTLDQKAKRQSLFRAASQNLNQEDEDAEQPQDETLARRLSRRLSTSSKKSRRSSRRRLSIFGGGGDVDSEDDVPAVPAVPATLRHEQHRDQGRMLGLTDHTLPPSEAMPGTAVTSDDTQDTTATLTRTDTFKRRSRRASLSRTLSRTFTREKSAPEHAPTISRSHSRKSSRRRSWLATSSNPDLSDSSRRNSSPPPIPALPSLTPDSYSHTSGSPLAATSPITDPFENFLLNSHRYSRHTSQPYHDLTDFDRFLQESAAFEALGLRAQGPRRHTVTAPRQKCVAPSYPNTTSVPFRGRRGSYAGPRSAAAGFLNTSSDAQLKRKTWRRSCAVFEEQDGGGMDTRDPIFCLEPEKRPARQSEWIAQGVGPREDEEGVMGMLRELERDDSVSSAEEWGRRGRGRADALMALECGVAR